MTSLDMGALIGWASDLYPSGVTPFFLMYRMIMTAQPLSTSAV